LETVGFSEKTFNRRRNNIAFPFGKTSIQLSNISLPRFHDWMPKSAEINGHDNTLFVIKCVHEMQDVRAMELIASFGCEYDGERYNEFHLADLNIAPAESTALFAFLGYIKHLHTLKIKNCRMGHFALLELVKLLQKENEIADLDDALRNENCKVTRLHITGHSLTAEGAKYVSDALKSDNCKLTLLDISDNTLTDEGAKYLSDALKSDNCKLTELNISANGLTVEGAKYLSDALKSDNCKLTELDISHNILTHVGAKYLSDALKSNNCKLTELDISHNGLTDEGVKYLSDALKSDNCKLTYR
jgi:Ran GTPase-activating protein (RanGAP) involved in mRNA processing and transport